MLKSIGVTNTVELDWWETHSVTKGPHVVDVVFTPAKHWTARTLFDRNHCLWGSFAVRGSRRVYFAGDTAYCPELFKAIGAELGPFDFSLIPIGAYKPRWFMNDVHCDPAEAVQIHLDLRAKQSLGVWVC